MPGSRITTGANIEQKHQQRQSMASSVGCFACLSAASTLRLPECTHKHIRRKAITNTHAAICSISLFWKKKRRKKRKRNSLCLHRHRRPIVVAVVSSFIFIFALPFRTRRCRRRSVKELANKYCVSKQMHSHFTPWRRRQWRSFIAPRSAEKIFFMRSSSSSLLAGDDGRQISSLSRAHYSKHIFSPSFSVSLYSQVHDAHQQQ